MSAPVSSWPASRSAQTTPEGYAVQDRSDPGVRSATRSSTTPASMSAECRRRRPSSRRETAATAVCGRANGMTKPSL